jgi:hypothetical protein
MSYYVFRLPKVIEDIIKLYTLGFGTRVCRIFRDAFTDLINNSNYANYANYANLATCWRLFVTLHGRVKCHSYSSVAFHDLQIARLQGPINVSHNMKQQLIEHENEFLKLHFKSSYYLYWNRCIKLIHKHT